ncbi:MAG: DUF2277 domain-containing protein [Polyangiales bacterium]
MCRNIRTLHHFEPPTTQAEIDAAALQFVRKVSGLTAPPIADRAAFDRAIASVAAATTELLAALHPPRSAARTREGEREKARSKWAQRAARIAGG